MISGERGPVFLFTNENQASLRGAMGKGRYCFPLAPLGNAPFPHGSDYVAPVLLLLVSQRHFLLARSASTLLCSSLLCCSLYISSSCVFPCVFFPASVGLPLLCYAILSGARSAIGPPFFRTSIAVYYCKYL